MWDATGDWQCLALRDVRLDIRIGVYDAEKAGPQRISVDVELWRRRGELARSLADCLDYDRIYRWLVDGWPGRPHTELLETLAEELVAKGLEDPRVEACRAVIRKLDAYGGVGWPEIELRRRRAD
jgi:dihydroneopterin aldolase